MSSLPKLITFDWDETLADTRQCIVSTMERTLEHYGKEPWDITKKKFRDKNKSLKENFPNFFGKNAEEAYNYYITVYKNHFINKATPITGSDLIIKSIENLRMTFGIISNKDKELLNHEIKNIFPQVNFHFVFGNGDAMRNKPDPAPIILACQQTKIEPTKQNVWHVGDSKQDVDCAINAGVTPILIGEGKFFEPATEEQRTLMQFDNLVSFSRCF